MTTTTSPLELVRDRLDAADCKPKRPNGNTFAALCPAHEDRNPSLSVSTGDDGRVLLNCHAGCSFDDIVAALGLEKRDMWPPDDDVQAVPPVTRLPDVDTPPSTYVYTDEDGQPLTRTVRHHPKGFHQERWDGQRWVTGLGDARRTLYRLPDVLAAIEQDRGVAVVEGEKDADRLAAAGIPATTNPMGAGKWDRAYTEQLTGARVFIVPDNDPPGARHAQQVAEQLQGVAAAVHIVELPGLPAKGDVSDWLDAGNTVHQLVELFKAAKPTSPLLERFPDVDWTEVWDGGLDEPDWIIDGLMETRRAAAVFAASGHGKSLLMLEAAACVATGIAFAGLAVPKARDVLYIDAENDLGDVVDRLKTFGFAPEDLGRLHYKSLPDLEPLDVEAGGQQLLALAEAHGADLVVIDTVARTVAGPENDADTYRAVARATGQLLKAAGIACWRIDHAGKDSTAGPRGSKAKTDDVDVVWEVLRDADQAWTLRTGTATLKKRSRHGLTSVQVARLDPDGLLSRRATSSRVVTLNEETDQVVQLMDDLEVPVEWGRRRAGDALRDAGHGVRNEVLAAAVKARKDRPAPVPEGSGSGTGLGTGLQQTLEAVRDRSGTAQDRETGTSQDDRSAAVPGSIGPGTADRSAVRPGTTDQDWPL